MRGWSNCVRSGGTAVLVLLAATVTTSGPVAAKDALPVPRFVSLRSDKVNMRVGPGRQYPIKWEFNQAGRPVEILQEYDVWRRVRDMDGTEGWVQQSLLTGKRFVIVTGKETRVLRRRADEASDAVARVEPKVLARLLECDPGWCRVEAGGVRGWLKRSEFWGVYPNEKIN